MPFVPAYVCPTVNGGFGKSSAAISLPYLFSKFLHRIDERDEDRVHVETEHVVRLLLVAGIQLHPRGRAPFGDTVATFPATEPVADQAGLRVQPAGNRSAVR